MPIVTVSSLDQYTHTQLVWADEHTLLADEPPSANGDDFGPSPYELLLSALGACTSMTLKLYARRKEYPLEHVEVELEHERVHSDDCAECEKPADGKIEVIRRRITLHGPLSDEQRDDLARVANKCPVHKTLAAAPEVLDTVLVEG